MKNAEWLIQNNIPFTDLRVTIDDPCVYKIYNWLDKKVYFTCPAVESLSRLKVVLSWLNAEHSEEVLTDSERTYLRWVVRPFKDSVHDLCVTKYASDDNQEFIIITYNEPNNHDMLATMTFPDFSQGTKYRGLELKRRYTLEELGID